MDAETTGTKTWNAFQVAESNGAYSGRRVRFMFDHELVDGALDKAIRSIRSEHVILTVRGDMYWVSGETLVEVH
jgi:hypothetical protein